MPRYPDGAALAALSLACARFIAFNARATSTPGSGLGTRSVARLNAVSRDRRLNRPARQKALVIIGNRATFENHRDDVDTDDRSVHRRGFCVDPSLRHSRNIAANSSSVSSFGDGCPRKESKSITGDTPCSVANSSMVLGSSAGRRFPKLPAEVSTFSGYSSGRAAY